MKCQAVFRGSITHTILLREGYERLRGIRPDHITTLLNELAGKKSLATGKVKAIGVANYSLRYLKQLLPEATIVPAVNQIENHPSLPQQEIVDFCNEKGIHVTAYSPLGSTGSPMMKEPAVVEVAEKKGVTPASVLLSYHSECWVGDCFYGYITHVWQLLEATLCLPSRSPLRE